MTLPAWVKLWAGVNGLCWLLTPLSSQLLLVPSPLVFWKGPAFAQKHLPCAWRGRRAPRICDFQLLPGVTSHVTTVSLLLPMGQLPGSFAYFINIF